MSKHSTTLTLIRDQPDDDLRLALIKTRDDLFRLRLGQHTNQVTSTAALTTKRREIAQIMTVLRGRQLGHETQAQKKATDVAAAAPAETDAPAKKAKATKAKTATTKKAKS